MQVIAESLSEEEIGGLKELFKMIDTDNSGTITFDELKDGLKRVGSELRENEIQALMEAVSTSIFTKLIIICSYVLPVDTCDLFQADIDNSGTIDYGEFIAATLHMNKLEREENLVSAFSFFDKDGSGFITIDELSQACREFGLDDVHLEDMIKDIDQNNVSPFYVYSRHLHVLVAFINLGFDGSEVNFYDFHFRMDKLTTASSRQ